MSASRSGSAGVLEAPPPRFTAAEAARIAAGSFSVFGTSVELPSERDQAFLINDGQAGGVLKISNLGENASVLDLETAAILHVARVDSELPVARPRQARAHGTDPGAYRATAEGADGTHFVRLFERCRGRTAGPDLDDRAVYEYAATHARLSLALRGLFHPAAGRELLWDLQHAPKLRSMLGAIDDERQRSLVGDVLDRYKARVVSRWPHLRAQVVHGDLTLGNVLFDVHGRISGILDFGDTGHSTVVADFAVGLASLVRGRAADDVFRIARIAVDGFASRLPFEPEELAVLADLVAARLATIVTISAWRVRRYPENAAYIEAEDADSWALLELFSATGTDEVAHAFGAMRPLVSTAELGRRRARALGSALTELTYRDPVHVARGEGVWLIDADGRRLLDAYNNVPVVGHCHPRVTEAVVRQTRTLNTHARYPYESLIELAERLSASMPPGSDLDTVMLVNSGSEANDIAWRFATAFTGRRGAVVTDHAYHGVTDAVADLSPEEWPQGRRPRNVETIPAPVAGTWSASAMTGAIDRLDARGVELAAAFVDGGFTSVGIQTPPPADVAAMVGATHAAGGLFVGDEGQAGYGRMGEHLWAFAGYGITPDVVTLGKPMGNGYPVAAVVTRAEIADRFAAETRLFSTFGGNPVAACAALAVLDVIEDERLIANAASVGSRLRRSLDEVGSNHRAITEVRGRGLLMGVELVTGSGEPDAALAERIVNALRDDGILIGRTGMHGNVLKIRPPLVFAADHADMLVAALAAALDSG